MSQTLHTRSQPEPYLESQPCDTLSRDPSHIMTDLCPAEMGAHTRGLSEVARFIICDIEIENQNLLC